MSGEATNEIYIFSLHEMKKWHIHDKNLNFLFIIYNFKRNRFFCSKWRHIRSHIASYKWWRCIVYNDGQNWFHKSRSRKSENFSKSWQFNYQNVPCDLTKKMNTHTLRFCPLIRKLQTFEILKWAQGRQWRKQRTSNFTHEIQLIFSLQWKYSFIYFHGCEIQLFKKMHYIWSIFFCISLLCI